VIKRKQVEQALLETQASLEKLEERIIPLQQANERLLHQIAEHQQAEQAVRLSEERYRALYNGISLTYFTMDANGVVLSVNQFGAAQLGYAVEELVGKTVMVVVYPEDQEFLRRQLAACLQNPISVNQWELRNVCKDGSVVWMKETAHGIRESTGRPVFLVACEDITRQKREELIREALYQVAEAAISPSDINALYRSIHQIVGQLMPAENFYIALHDPTTNLVHYPYFVDQYDPVPIPELCQDSLTAQVIQTGRKLLVAHEVQEEIAREQGMKILGTSCFDWLGVPLKVENRTIGMMAVQSYTEQVRYGEKELGLMEFVYTQIAMAIERKRAFEEIRKHLQRLNALHVIDMACTNSLGLDLTLGILLDQTIDQMIVDAADIRLLSPDMQVLEHAVRRGFRSVTNHNSLLSLHDTWIGQVVLERVALHLYDIAETRWRDDFRRSFEGEDFVTYFGVPIISNGQVKGVLEVYHRSLCQPSVEWLNFLNALATQAAIVIDHSHMVDALQKSNQELTVAYDATLEGWSYALELRDGDTQGHSKRVTTYTLQLARALKVPYQDFIHIRRGALLHDIGKMGIPDHILRKPGPLDAKEWDVMQKHPIYAYEMLAQIPYLRSALDIPYHHHERWDGSGYPGGLKGEEIPLPARIFAIVDVWDALSNERPYRKAWKREEVLGYIQEQSGKQFDPQIVTPFLELIQNDVFRK
jgi:PAS domain S-box-containing protein/putative nucleotidyltransferase with HDIG domain